MAEVTMGYVRAYCPRCKFGNLHTILGPPMRQPNGVRVQAAKCEDCQSIAQIFEHPKGKFYTLDGKRKRPARHTAPSKFRYYQLGR
jgi:phage FluMu protein Com